MIWGKFYNPNIMPPKNINNKIIFSLKINSMLIIDNAYSSCYMYDWPMKY